MIARLPLTALCAALLISPACDRASEPVSDQSAADEVTPISGMYEVAGTTIETTTGRRREISGAVILSEDGSSYTATFHLATTFEGEGGVLPAEVIGKGSGTIDGRTLRGDAETQLVIAGIPGIDPAFAYIPRTTTTRLVSKSVATIAADGSLEIEIENAGAAGEIYAPTRTTLKGIRIGAAGVAGLEGTRPPVAAPPAEANE